MNEGRKAAIVGAGIGGLAAGISLGRVGYEVTVYERAGEIRPLGAGLLIWPNGIKALRALGLDAFVDAPGPSLGTGAIRRSDGSVLAEFDPKAITKRWGEPILAVHRAALHEALLEHLGQAKVTLGREVSSVGDLTGADIVVGADGIHSTVRSEILDDGDPVDSGVVAYRGVAAWDQPIPAGEWWGDGSVAGLARVGEGQVYWYVAHRGEPGEPAAFAEGYADPVAEIVAATDPAAVLTHRLFDRAPSKRWVEGNVALLGDAAHPMLPFLGQGACAALEDAVALGDAVAGTPDATQALRDYESARVKRASQLVRGSRQAAKVALAGSTAARRLRNTAIGHAPQGVRFRQLDRVVGIRG